VRHSPKGDNSTTRSSSLMLSEACLGLVVDCRRRHRSKMEQCVDRVIGSSPAFPEIPGTLVASHHFRYFQL
jgi:hypothetical protein